MNAHHSSLPDPARVPTASAWAPSPAWRHHVRLFGVRDTRGCGLAQAQRYNRFAAIPYCGIHWILEGQSELVSIGARRVAQPVPKWSVSGCFNAPVTALNPGDVHVFGVAFFPDAFHALFGVDLSSLHNRVEDAMDVLPPHAIDMVQAVAFAENHAQRQTLIEAYLARHADPARDTGWQRLREMGWQTGLNVAAQLMGVGPRQVQRLFQREVGLNLRDFLLLQRSEWSLLHACLKTRRGESFTWAEHAADLGYADQAHLSRDCKARTGRTPTQLAQDRQHEEADWMYRLEVPMLPWPLDDPMHADLMHANHIHADQRYTDQTHADARAAATMRLVTDPQESHHAP